MSAPASSAPSNGGAEETTPLPPEASGSDSEPNSASNVGAEQGSPSTAPDVEALRAEVADWRTKAESAQQDIASKIAAALGLGGADETPTVEQVTEQLTAAQHEARERAVDLAVYRAAPTAGADPDALLDSTAFRRRVANLDPAAEEFANQVAAVITDAIKANPRLAATPTSTPPAPRSGGQITGGSPSGSDDLGSLSVEDYIKRTRKGRS